LGKRELLDIDLALFRYSFGPGVISPIHLR